MPRSQGTSRKGKPKKADRAAGMGRALARAQRGGGRPNKPKGGSTGGMAATTTISIGMEEPDNTPKSVLEMDHLDDFLVQANMAGRQFESEKERFVVLDSTGMEYRPTNTKVQWADQPKAPQFDFQELSVPRRPEWNAQMTAEELQQSENEAFLEWRRGIAAKEEELFAVAGNSPATVTPFEKNLDVWRQLWRVMERCSCIVQLIDARNPLFYLSEDLRRYATEELGKPMLVIVNKSDYLSPKQRQQWSRYLKEERGWDHVFFSAHIEQRKLDEAAQRERKEQLEIEKPKIVVPQQEDEEDKEEEGVPGKEKEELEHDSPQQDAQEDVAEAQQSGLSRTKNIRDNIGIKNPLTRKQLIEWLKDFAIFHKCEPDSRFDNRIQFGMVGFPNVGKSSIINVLVGSSKHTHGVVRVGVAAQPGKTKHFQTLFLPDRDDIMLCDCPGLVFPSFVSSTADLIAAGVYPIAQMRDHWPVTNLIAKRIPRQILNAQYGIHIPEPSTLELNERGLEKLPPPTGEELLTTYCVARSMLTASSGIPDHQRAARVVITDYAAGKLLYCHAPPNVDDADAFECETVYTAMKRHQKLQTLMAAANAEKEEDESEDEEANSGIGAEAESNKNAVFDDDDLLDFLGGPTATNDSSQQEGKRNKRNKGGKKWGKKGRKLRNSDPYGCHSTPDDMLHDTVAPSGVVINAGKYGKKGYTRPTNYAGARSAAAGGVSNKPKKGVQM